MFTFNLVRKIGEGNYLDEDSFILERARKERALNIHCVKMSANRNKNRIFEKNGKLRAS